MKKSISYSIVCSALLMGGSFAVSAAEEGHAHGAPMGREEAVLVEVTAKVEAIDLKTREVTLKGPLGNEVTFTVDERVKRLNEVKVGDDVHADYYVSVAGELRKPTAEEEKNPITVLSAAAKAPQGTSPAAGGLRQYKVVTTVEGLDRPTKTVTLKGPMGRYLTVRVADPERLTKAHIGDHVVVTYTEALAISLDKAEKKSSD
jgi:Cu/Ag efflux protein CusF